MDDPPADGHDSPDENHAVPDEHRRQPQRRAAPESESGEQQSEAALLTDDDFLPAAGDAPDGQAPLASTQRHAECLMCGAPVRPTDVQCRCCGERLAPRPTPARPGPGLPEAVAWIAGVVAVQVMATLVVTFVILFFYGLTADGRELAGVIQDPNRLAAFMTERMAPLFGGIQAIMVPAALVAVRLRLRRDYRRNLPVRPIPLRHGVLLGLLVLFLVPFCSQLLIVMTGLWDSLIESLPGLKSLEEQGSLKGVESLAQGASLPFLLAAVALAPALWEELVFRGVVGRGLVARLGLWPGILITSCLFAAIHLFPPQVVALLPLAVCIHVAYLATRSIWVPMAIHLLNNAAGVVAIKLMLADPQAAAQVENYTPPPELVIGLGCCVLAVAWLMWKMRVQYYLPDGTLWDPGYVTADVPPRHLSAERRCARLDIGAVRPLGIVLLTLLAAAASAVTRYQLGGM